MIDGEEPCGVCSGGVRNNMRALHAKLGQDGGQILPMDICRETLYIHCPISTDNSCAQHLAANET